VLPYRKPTEGRDHWVIDDVGTVGASAGTDAADRRGRCSSRVSAEAGRQLLSTPPAEHRQVRPATAYAIAALEEVAKFLPDGADRIPQDRFVSERGRAMYAQDPTRFTRKDITAALELKRKILADIDHFSPPQG
jgi:hypothetical protein